MYKRWWKLPSGEHWIRFHTSNEYDSRRPWTTWLHGRGWLSIGQACISGEWRWFGSSCHIGIDVNGYGERDVLFKIAIPGLVSFYLGLEGVIPVRWLPEGERRIDLRIFGKAIWWNVWHDDSSWSRETPRWRAGSWHPLDTIFGRMNYQSIPLKEERTVIPLPEGLYPCTVQLSEARWKRPRAFWVARVYRAEITPDTPIPIPGKGENSYDQDDDATFSLTCPARTVPEATATLVKDILTTRERRGGHGWIPEKGWHPDLVEP